MRMRGLLLLMASTAVLIALAAASVSAAFAETPVTAPWWGLTTGSRPSSLPAPGGGGEIVVTAENLGDARAEGALGEVRIVDSLPAGLEAIGIKGIAGQGLTSGNRGEVTCALAKLECTFKSALPAFEEIEVQIRVKVKPGAHTGEVNAASVTGGGAGTANASRPITVGEPSRFGFEEFSLVPENPGGTVDTQAGSHPFQLTNVIMFNTQTADHAGRPRSMGLPRDVAAQLPAGLVGNPTVFAQCTDSQFGNQPQIAGVSVITNECPAASAIGVATVTLTEPKSLGYFTVTAPIFNMKPRVGEPARFGFKATGIFSVFLDTAVRTGSDYGVTVTSSNITQVAWPIATKLTFWGVPGDPRHDEQRGWECLKEFGSCPHTTATTPPPFLVMPTSCQAPYVATVGGDSWGSPGEPSETAEAFSYHLPEALDGCNHLPFSPEIITSLDVSSGSTPSGLTADVHVPQTAALNPEGLAESSVKNISVTFPEGVTVNPASANGLEACGEAEIGFLGEAPGEPEAMQFTDGLPAAQGEAPRPFCSDAAKIGTVRIKTPLLADAVEGALYLASPAPQHEAGRNPFNSLIAVYIVAQDPVSGTLVKLPGEVSLNQSTGQITTTFKNSPELPFEDAEIHLFGGERAPFATPAHCGAYSTQASFVSWSGQEVTSPSSTFHITSGPNGSPCPGGALPFSPSLTAGDINIQAGAFSPFTTTMSREDGQQNLKGIQLQMPPGLAGILTGVPLCGETQADTGSCPAASLIGETTVSVGLGGDPFTVKGGQVFLTGPYRGAPFGLSIVNPAVAGPFDLGKVIVRAAIQVDPSTAALTVTSDSSGPYAIPPSIDGIPLEIKHVNVAVNRPGFTFNPTNCNPQAITGNLQSIEGATATLNVPFQVTNCATLKFTPTFTASISGKASKASGTSLTTKVTEPAGSMGTQANITKVKVDLPIQLPSRLTTLQKACLYRVFNANPAACPPQSIIGYARVITPLLPVPLTGPAYFVSHGGEAFPSLTLVLQGYGVTVDLVGTTFISKAGITSTTFNTVPDTPFNTFELTLPQGPFSALGANLPAKANGSFCGQNLKMPTLFVAQNGAEIHQQTPIAVTGCAKAKTRAQLYAAALKACHKDKNKGKRQACERTARKRYGPVKKKK